MTDYQIQRSLDGSTSTIVTETGVVKSGQGVLRRITTTATSSGTLVVLDGTEASTVATSTLTSSGACVPAIHGGSTLTSTGNSAAATHASATLTVAGGVNFAADETVTIDTTVYTFKVRPEQAYQVKIGATPTASLLNLKNAINGSSTYANVTHGAGTVAHASVVAYTSDSTTVVVKGRTPGSAYDALATTETCANASFGGATMVDGVATTNSTVTIGAITYTQVDVLSETYGAAAVPFQVLRGVSEAVFYDNLKAAINATGTAGTEYSTGTTAHPYMIATTNTDTTQVIKARTVGNAAFTAIINALATTETMANTAWTGAAVTNGVAQVTSDAATITIGTRTYTAVTALDETTGATAVADQILWVTSEAVFLDNIKKAINQTGIAGTDYSTGTTVNTQVVATTNSNTQQVINTRLLGSAGNSIATTTTLGNYAWTSTVMASGTGATGKIILDTYTPAAGANIDLGNIEFENGLFVTVGGTSISATFTYK